MKTYRATYWLNDTQYFLHVSALTLGDAIRVASDAAGTNVAITRWSPR